MSKFTIVFRVQCYVSVITEKYDLSFQLTYYTLAFDFQTSAERHALLDMSRIQQTVVLDLRTSNILISGLPIHTIDQLISKRIQRDTQVHRECPSSTKNRDGERSSIQQFTHPVHPSSSYHLWYLLRQFWWARRRNTSGKTNNNKQDRVHRKTIIFSEN